MTATVDVRAGLRDRGALPEIATHPIGTDVVDVPVYFRKNDDCTWSFRIDNPAILGGAHRTREDAERCAVAALARALRGGDHGAWQGETTGYLLIALRGVRGSHAAGAAPHHVDTNREVFDLLLTSIGECDGVQV